METQLRQLLEIANKTIPELVDSYNEDTREYHVLHDELERLRALEQKHLSTISHLNRVNSHLNDKAAEMWETLQKQNEIIKRQGKELQDMLGKHKAVVNLSNSRITRYESALATAEGELRELKNLNPRKLEKVCREQKAKLAERASKISALEGNLRNERRISQGLRNRLEEQKIGFWQRGKERLIPFLGASVMQRKDLMADSSVTERDAVWWQHECGLKILCGYDAALDEIFICDPSDENQELRRPTLGAEKSMLSYFRNQNKVSKH